jgi:hypothetical protein
MANWLKQSTATTVKMGPFLSSTDGDTEMTSLTIAQASIRLTKNGAGFAQTHNSAGATHDEKGYYGVPLDDTDTNTLGRLRVAIHVATSLAVWQDFFVVPANVFDSLIGGTANLKVDLDTVKTQAVTCGAGVTVLASVGTAAASTAQTGDSYPIVSHADYGNAKLVRSTTPANTLTVDTSHRALSDLASILATALTETSGYLAAGFRKFFNIQVPAATVASVDQTGDAYARIGAAGAGLTALGDARLANLDATVGSRSSHSAADVWASTTRTLSSFGTLIADIWTYVTRTLTAFAFTPSLDATYNAAKSAAQAGDPMTLTAAYDAAKTAAPTGAAMTLTAAYDAAKTAAPPGAAMTLTSAYDAAKTAAPSGAKMDVVDVPNAAAVTAIQAGLAIASVQTAIKAKTDLIPASPAAIGDIPTANQNADALLDRANGIETGITLRQATRAELAAAAGKLSGVGTAVVVIRAGNDSKDRITAATDGAGNRTAVSLDLT